MNERKLTKSKKPHPMAERAAVPCVKCGYDWTRLVVNFSDEDAEELPVYDACARCMTRVEATGAA